MRWVQGDRADQRERTRGQFTLPSDHEYLHATSFVCLHATSFLLNFICFCLICLSTCLLDILSTFLTILARPLSARRQINPPTAIPVAPTTQTHTTRRSARATSVSRSG